jgi:hypothetical protein
VSDGIDPADELGLADLIRRVREELEEADAERQMSAEDPLLALDQVALDLQFTLTRRKGGKGGIDLKVVSLEGAKGIESSAVHTVSVRFVVDPEARDARLTGSRAHSTTPQGTQPELGPIDDTP